MVGPALAVSLLMCGVAGAQGTPPYLDAAQPIDKRVADLISRMTLEEKAECLFHNSKGIARLKVPAWGGWNQSLHGIYSNQITTLFPVPIAQAATWNPALVHEITSAIADEARALYHSGGSGMRGKAGLVYRAPVINISRDPRWGRIQECFSEDPFLCGRITVAYVKGLQGDHPKYLKVAATLKHFAVNNQETGRFSFLAQVPERMLHEYWLPHFKDGVVEGKVCSLMAAYNGINGEPCAVNKVLLTDILRAQWGFEGFVVSDLGGIGHLVKSHKITQSKEEAVARALLAGCDYDDEEYRDAIPGAVKKGLVSEKVVDQALARVLKVAFRLGVFDPPEQVPFSKTPASVIASAKHRELSLRTARESIVLLSNKDRFLPLDRTKVKKVAVIGPAAARPEYGNYYLGQPKQKLVHPLDGIKNKLGNGVEVVYARGSEFLPPAKGKVPADPKAALQAAEEAARTADVVFLCLGTVPAIEAEGRDRKELGLPKVQQDLLEAVVQANPKTVVVLFNAGPLSVKWARDHAAAVLEAWYPGEEGGTAVADVLFGDVNPAGRLPYTVYESTNDIPPQTEYDITKGFTYLYFTGTPVFPFGHGLSYTQFGYSDLKLSAPRMTQDGKVEVSVTVKNIGDRAGEEVAQLYVHQVKSSVKRPIKELRGFQRVHLKPGEAQTLTFTLPAEKLAYYDVGRHDFVVEPGTFDVMVGSSSADIRVRGQVEVAAAKEAPVTPQATLQGHKHTITCLAFSRDGHYLASGSKDCTVILWDLHTGKATAHLEGHVDMVLAVAFSPDGKRLASTSHGPVIHLWDTATGKEIAQLRGHAKDVRGVAFAPDGKTLYSASSDQTVKVWDLETRQEKATWKGHTAEINCVALSPSAMVLASGGWDDTVRLWDTATGKLIATLEGHTDMVRDLAFNREGTLLVSSGKDGIIRIWDVAAARLHDRFEGHKGLVRSLSLAPDGKLLASAGKEGQLHLWDFPGGKLRAVLDEGMFAFQVVAFSPDGKTFATGGIDKKVSLWEVAKVLQQASPR
jgi:beta-glucosidase